MEKIVEIIPDDLPEWAIEAMEEGQLFRRMLERIRELEEVVAKLERRMGCVDIQKV